MATLFLRAHTYTAKTAAGVLAEADRQPDACPHVASPKSPGWIGGDAATVRERIEAYMATPETVTLNNGRQAQRKRRHDARCLVAGVVSYPLSNAALRSAWSDPSERERFKQWAQNSQEFIKRTYGQDAVFCMHMDETHPHLHFFVVGNANKLHHGLRAEFDEDGKRIKEGAARKEAHKAGLSAWLDDYWLRVGQALGFARSEGSRPGWRVRDRQVRAKIVEIDKALAERPDADLQQARDDLWQSAPKAKRSDLSF